MTISPGTRLGHFEIIAPIGAGGMGQVYRARDTRLDRTVAIKVLPPNVHGDEQARERFEREARAVAALNHPHICTLHDIGREAPSSSTDQTTQYLVMEYLEGETLAARLTKGALPLAQSLTYAVEIASALDRAHRAGIVHRDIKPGNIMVTKEGTKLLDFGLAKASGPMMATDVTRPPATGDLTEPGLILGTVQYMAPEQVEGKTADARTDIFAFGVVLFEMLTGRKAFEGSSPGSLMAAILDRELPPVSSLQPQASSLLDHVIQRCLAKDPDRRWQSARDVMLELESVAERVPVSMPSSRRMRSAVVLAGLGGMALAGGAAWFVGRSAANRPADTPVVQQVARITHESGFSEWPTWAPDGRLFAFASNRSGNFEIYVRRVEGGQEVNISDHAAADVQPAFSPDGTSIAFVSTRSSVTGLVKIGAFIGFDVRTYGGDIWIVPTLGGQARRLAENGNFPSFHPSGRTVIYVGGAENHRTILEVSIDGGQPNPILPAASSSWEITRVAYAPSARWITFETSDRRLFAMSAAGRAPVELLRGSSHAWDPDGGRVYYANQLTLGGTRIEVADVRETSTGLAVDRIAVAGVSTGTLGGLAMAADRQRLLTAGVEESVNLSRLPLSAGGDVAGPEERLSDGLVRDNYPRVSPDGQRIAVGSNRLGSNDLWILHLSGHRRWERLEMPPASQSLVSFACWAKDGRHLAVNRYFQDGTKEYRYMALDGSSAEQLIPPIPGLSGNFPCAFSPDGQRFVYTQLLGGFSQLFVMDLQSRRSHQLTTSPSHKFEAAWSPDGRWLAFSANTSGAIQIWRIPVDGGDETQLTTGSDRMLHLFYSPDGRWLYVHPNHRNIFRLPANGGPLQQVTRFPEESDLFLEEPTISPDGRWLVYNRGRGGSSLWMLTIGGQ